MMQPRCNKNNAFVHSQQLMSLCVHGSDIPLFGSTLVVVYYNRNTRYTHTCTHHFTSCKLKMSPSITSADKPRRARAAEILLGVVFYLTTKSKYRILWGYRSTIVYKYRCVLNRGRTVFWKKMFPSQTYAKLYPPPPPPPPPKKKSILVYNSNYSEFTNRTF